MKKLFTLVIFTILFAMYSYSQGLETFTKIPASSNSYSARTWVGDNAITWNCSDARTDQTITTQAIGVRNSTLTSGSFAGGVGNLSFNCKYLFTGSAASLSIKINGNIVGTVSVASTQTTTLSTTISNINTSGNCIIEIQQTVTGSRVAIDDIAWTGYNVTPCTTPTSQPTALTFSTITSSSINGSFTASNPVSDKYLVVMSSNPSLGTNPSNGQTYINGDNIGGDGLVVGVGNSLGFTATGLSQSTTYYFYVFAYNSNSCTGGPVYNITNPLTNNTTTLASLPPCTSPSTQPTNLIFSGSTVNTISGSFTSTTADQYLVLVSTSNTLAVLPQNGTNYVPDNTLGNAKIVQQNSSINFTANALLSNTTYYFFIFSLNNLNCINGPIFNITNPLTNNAATQPLPPCATPTNQPTNLVLNPSSNAISGNFSAAADADNYLIILSTSNTLSDQPIDNTDYVIGSTLGGGTVIANGSATSFVASGLTSNVTYYVYVFSSNKNCSGGTKYLTISPLTGNTNTLAAVVNNIYFGNLHSHSAYSDGNTDNLSYTPTEDFSYAKSSLCMDFLGIAEHNHNTANTTITNYHTGTAKSNSFTASNPGFLALYGMEWGTIGGGGHLIVYGDQMDELIGWETTATGVNGPNYDTYVAKGDYTGANGIFKTINDRVSKNTFATLAHPNDADYQNILGSYNAVADNAVVGVALENGPSTSANTTYSDPGTSLNYLPYFNTMLSRGYHVGPNIDHDNHKTTFGRTTKSRTAVIAQSLTKTEIIKGMRDMHFYATQDCDAKVDFSINTKMMGTIFTDRNAPTISISFTDPTNTTSASVIKILRGVPGSNILPAVIFSSNSSSANFTDNTLTNSSTGYYYADITYGAGRIITSPIWYTRNDASILPVTLSIFEVIKQNNTVKVLWKTQQELNSSHFVIQRSTNGQKWNDIEKIKAAGNSNLPVNYFVMDLSPNIGVNLYRLKQVDVDGNIHYTNIKTVLFNKSTDILISPNPTSDIINIYIGNNKNNMVTIYLYHSNGSLLKKIDSKDSKISIDASTLAKGLYFIKTVVGDNISIQKVVLQ